MNRLTTLDINKITTYAVGFDRVFVLFHGLKRVRLAPLQP